MIKVENAIVVSVTIYAIAVMALVQGISSGESIPVPAPSVPVKICDVCK